MPRPPHPSDDPAPLDRPPVALSDAASLADPAHLLARAVEARARPGTDLDGALVRFAARARQQGAPVERMLAALARLLAAHVRPLRPGDDPQVVTALVLRRAITAYYRDAAA